MICWLLVKCQEDSFVQHISVTCENFNWNVWCKKNPYLQSTLNKFWNLKINFCFLKTSKLITSVTCFSTPRNIQILPQHKFYEILSHSTRITSFNSFQWNAFLPLINKIAVYLQARPYHIYISFHWFNCCHLNKI